MKNISPWAVFRNLTLSYVSDIDANSLPYFQLGALNSQKDK